MGFSVVGVVGASVGFSVVGVTTGLVVVGVVGLEPALRTTLAYLVPSMPKPAGGHQGASSLKEARLDMSDSVTSLSFMSATIACRSLSAFMS